MNGFHFQKHMQYHETNPIPFLAVTDSDTDNESIDWLIFIIDWLIDWLLLNSQLIDWFI